MKSMRLKSISTTLLTIALMCGYCASVCGEKNTTTSQSRPNILLIMSDDHSDEAISAYGSKINKTPNIDRLANEGVKLTNCFATNALCAPSRACILTGKYNCANGFRKNGDKFDNTQMTFPKLLQRVGYQTAVIGKWHLNSDPTGFDYWSILPGQGIYKDPFFIENGTRVRKQGYVTDLITSASMDWIDKRDPSRPFMLLCYHKAPHRPWVPDEAHATMYENEDIPTPATFDDTYTSRGTASKRAQMRMDDLTTTDTKIPPPPGLQGEALKKWKYERFIKDYLRCIASVDDNVGRLLKHLEEKGLLDNTIVIYTSDQGFFLGDHGWFDKRFMYEHSARMPFVVRYPKELKPKTVRDEMILNVDFAPTLLDYAGVKAPEEMHGKSFRQILAGKKQADWRDSMYYHFYEYPDPDHMVARHYGVRTDRYKLIHYYYPWDEWELFDLQKDPDEMQSIYDDPAYAEVVKDLKQKLIKHRETIHDDDPTTGLAAK